MKKHLFSILSMAVLLLWGVTTASAATLTWKVLTHSSVAGSGPGPDKLIGTTDDTTSGEINKCNYSTAPNCAATGNPTIGSYSYSAVEMDGNLTHACLGGSIAGQPCKCSDLTTPCTVDGDCPGALCAPGDCCPGMLGLATCMTCVQNDPEGEPFGPPLDTYTYAGSAQNASGTLTTCQEADPPGDTDPPTEFEIKAVEFAGSEPLPGFAALGDACMRLRSIGAPYLGSPCTGSGPISATVDVETFIANCTIPAGSIDNIRLTGDIIDITNPNSPSPSTSTCGYTNSELVTIANQAIAADPNAKHLMIVCGETTFPPTSEVPCMRGGIAYVVWLLYTADDASQCPDNGCPQ